MSCGLKIDKPFVWEHYTSIPFERFISFNRSCYPYYAEVLQLIGPELKKAGIDVVQLKCPNNLSDTPISIPDGMTFGQYAYIMKHSLLHFGEDSFLFDLAGHYDIPRLILFSNTYPNTSKPFWGTKEKERILFTTGPHSKPSLSPDPALNFVARIKPEQIALNIMELLGIKWTPPYETVYIGKNYRPKHDIVELFPDSAQSLNLTGSAATLGIRLDYNFDEKFLVEVLKQSRACIITDRPINIKILEALRNNIIEVTYLIDFNSDSSFSRELSKLNLTHVMATYARDEEFIKIKAKFFDIGVVHQLPIFETKNMPEFKDQEGNIHYKSAKRILHGNKSYKSQHDLLNNIPSDASEFLPCIGINHESFCKELEFFFVTKPVVVDK